MALNTLAETFEHQIGDIYDAEHRFLDAQREMLGAATNDQLKAMLQEHSKQTQQQIENLEQVWSLLGQKAKRIKCDAASGLVSEGQKGIKETSDHPELRDILIANAAGKVEHYEIASYRALIDGAELLGKAEIVALLHKNLQQEEQTADKIEKSTPRLLQQAMAQQKAGK